MISFATIAPITQPVQGYCASPFCIKGTNTDWGGIVVPPNLAVEEVTDINRRLCKKG